MPELTAKDVLDLITSSPITYCGLDPVPVTVFKWCLPRLLEVITEIVNLSLSSGEVQAQLKVAQVTPLLKKHKLDPDILNNYRPISNPPCLSKLIEHAVAKEMDTT